MGPWAYLLRLGLGVTIPQSWMSEEVYMKGFVALAVLALGTAAVVHAADSAVDKGKAVYESATPKCKTCHSVGGVGNPKGALEGTASKLKADEVKAWLRTPKEMTEKTKATRKPMMPTYGPDKISDADVDALAAYLLSLK
jgi:mono/diheme cytochrome c family protein